MSLGTTPTRTRTDYYTSQLLVSQADQRLLRDLVRQTLPAVSKHLEELDLELEASTFGWYLSLFTIAFPAQTFLRVWDAFLVDGSVVLFRVTLALLKLFEAETLACDNAAAFHTGLKAFAAHLYTPDRLMQQVEKLRSAVKTAQVESLREDRKSVV